MASIITCKLDLDTAITGPDKKKIDLPAVLEVSLKCQFPKDCNNQIEIGKEILITYLPSLIEQLQKNKFNYTSQVIPDQKFKLPEDAIIN